MIKETTINTYGKYFLSLEADDELNDDENIKFNTKIITVKPTKRRSDLYKIGDDYLSSDEPEKLPEEENPNENINHDEPSMDDMDDTSDVPPEEGAPEEPTEVNTNEPVMDEDPLVQQVNSTNAEINNENPQEQPTEEPMVDTGDTEVNTDEPVMDEEPLPDEGGEVPPEEGAPEEASVDPNAQPVKRGPGIEYDSTRRYILFNKYIDLCNSIKTYTERLSANQVDDEDLYRINNLAIKKLNEIYDVTYDYILMKFELSSYVQSLLFFQERIVNISKVFDLIKEANLAYQKKMKKK